MIVSLALALPGTHLDAWVAIVFLDLVPTLKISPKHGFLALFYLFQGSDTYPDHGSWTQMLTELLSSLRRAP